LFNEEGSPLEAWVMAKNSKGKELLNPSPDAASKYAAKEAARLEALQPTEEKPPAEDKKKGEEKKGGGGGGGGGGDGGGEFDLPEPPPKKNAPPAAAAAPKAAAKAGPVSVSGGGDFWVTLSAGKVRDAANSSGEVVEELSKGDFVKCVATQDDWIKCENIWSDKGGEAWLMVRNKKGKQMAEAAPDPAKASATYEPLKVWQKQLRLALADGKDPPPKPGGGGSGGGGGMQEIGGGGFGKKALTEEEAECLAMLKGHGKSNFDNNDGGGSGGDSGGLPEPPPKKAAPKPPPPAAAAAKPSPPKAKAAVAVSGGGNFWTALQSGRVRSLDSSKGEVLGEVNKGDFVKCVATQGDWIKVNEENKALCVCALLVG
jgi:hypothetical protein